MNTFKRHPIFSTLEDSQGERRDKQFLVDLLKRLPSRYPLGQHHDAALPTCGYIENFDLEEIPSHPGEWQIVGDVCLEDGVNITTISGISFSTVEVVQRQPNSLGALYVPYPFYREQGMFDEILSYDPQLNAGRWIKKSADPCTIALIGLAAQATYFLLTPAWKTTWDDTVWPFLKRVGTNYLAGRLKDKPLEYGYTIQGHTGEKIRVHFASNRHLASETLLKALQEEGLKRAITFISNDAKAKSIGIATLKLYFHSREDGFKLCDVQYLDGTSITLI
jgi:hypothetical protein